MKVCLLTRYFDFRNAGLGRVSMEVLKGLRERGYEVSTVSTNGDSLLSYFLYTSIEIPFRILNKKADVYHALTPIEGMWLPQGRSVVTFHDLILLTHPEMMGSGAYGRKSQLSRYYFEFVCRAASKAARVVCVSEETSKEVQQILKVPESRIRVIHSGIREDLGPIDTKRVGFRIGCLGQLDRRKRVDLLIQAFHNSKLDADLFIAGTGPDRSNLRELAEDDYRIRFLGLVPDDKLVEFYNSIDLLVFPSMIEGYGLPIVEAMACKKPVMVLSDSIIPWGIKKRCIIVENLETVFSSYDYLENLMKYIGYEGNYRWAKSHTWGRCLDEYIEVYKEVVK